VTFRNESVGSLALIDMHYNTYHHAHQAKNAK
jgi:hypothetical protein